MVCALHSNWQLCGKDALLFVLGNINSHPSVLKKEKKEEELELAGLIWTPGSHSTQHKHILYMIWDNEKEKPTHLVSLICSVPVPCQTTELPPPPSPSQEANQLSSINQTQSIDSYLVKRSTNELGFDRYGVLKNQ